MVTRIENDYQSIRNLRPNIRVGGIPILAQNFVWQKTAGITPYSTQIKVPIEFNAALEALQNPVDITIAFQGGVGAQNFNKANNFVIRNCFLHEPRLTEFHAVWQISDFRYALRGQKCFFNFNETRIKNELGLINPVQSKANFDTDPGAIRSVFDAFALGRYVKASVKPDNTVFTNADIIKIELAKKGINVKFPSNLSQFDYALENVRAEGEDFYTCITSLLAKTRMNVFATFDGELELYSIDFFDQNSANDLITLGNRKKSSIGEIYQENKRKIRPSRVTVRFEKMVETMVSFADIDEQPRQSGSSAGTPRRDTPAQPKINNATTQQQASNLTTIPCINVVQAQFIPANFLGVYNVGEYIEIGEYLQLFGLSKDLLRQNFFSEAFAIRLRPILGGLVFENLALASQIASNIKASFRQLFMIEPVWMDRIKKWENKRVEIVDQFSGTRPPSPLYQDIFTVPRVKDLAQARGQLDSVFSRSTFIDAFDPNREKITPGTIKIVNPELGIFNVSYPPTTDSVIAEIIPSALEEDVAINPTLGNHLLDLASLSEEHTMETLVSIVWNYDNRDNFDSSNINNPTGKYHDIEYDFSQGNAQFGPSEGPPITIMCNREYARFDRELKLINPTLIDNIANAEVTKNMNKFRDRFAGILTLPEWIDYPIIGNISSISYAFTPTEGATMTIDASNPPFDPSVEQSLPEKARAMLYRQLEPRNGP